MRWPLKSPSPCAQARALRPRLTRRCPRLTRRRALARVHWVGPSRSRSVRVRTKERYDSRYPTEHCHFADPMPRCILCPSCSYRCVSPHRCLMILSLLMLAHEGVVLLNPCLPLVRRHYDSAQPPTRIPKRNRLRNDLAWMPENSTQPLISDLLRWERARRKLDCRRPRTLAHVDHGWNVDAGDDGTRRRVAFAELLPPSSTEQPMRAGVCRGCRAGGCTCAEKPWFCGALLCFCILCILCILFI